MKQADLGLNLTTKRTRKREFLAEMERVVPWAALVGLITPYAPEGRRGRPPFAVETMLRIHFMQQWLAVAELCRKHGMSAATYYAWKSKYAGASVSDLVRMKELEAENTRLKRMYADLALENAAIKEVMAKKF